MFQIQADDYRYSGPEVWPRLTAETQPDLFIFRRPELAYLEAIRRNRAHDERNRLEPSPVMTIRVERLRHRDKKFYRTKIDRVIRHVIEDDRTDDVRKLLRTLREVLQMIMPEKPSQECVVRIRFYSQDHRPVLSFQERWV